MKPVEPRSLPLPDGACNEAFTLRLPARSSDKILAAYRMKAVRDDVLDRGGIDFPHLRHVIRNAMLTVWPRLRRLAS